MNKMEQCGEQTWAVEFMRSEYFRGEDFWFHAQVIMAVLAGERLNQSLIRRILAGAIFALPAEVQAIADEMTAYFMSPHGDLPFGGKRSRNKGWITRSRDLYVVAEHNDDGLFASLAFPNRSAPISEANLFTQRGGVTRALGLLGYSECWDLFSCESWHPVVQLG